MRRILYRKIRNFKQVTFFMMKIIRDSEFVDSKFTLQYLSDGFPSVMSWHVTVSYEDNKKGGSCGNKG